MPGDIRCGCVVRDVTAAPVVAMNDIVVHCTPEFSKDDTEGTVRVCGCCGRGWVLQQQHRSHPFGYLEQMVRAETRGEQRERERAQRRLTRAQRRLRRTS